MPTAFDPHAVIYGMVGQEALPAVCSPEVAALAAAVEAAADAVKGLKTKKAPKADIEAAVAALLAAKQALTAAAPTHPLVAVAKKPAAAAKEAPSADQGGERKLSKKEQKRAARGDTGPAKEKDANRWAVDPEKAALKAAKLAERQAEKAANAEEDDAEAVAPPTPAGDRKILAAKMTKTYNPAAVEASWQEWWEKSGWYGADAEVAKKRGRGKKFVMVIPPPNVTGSLHLGHALTAAIEDGLTRWHRMRGDVALYVPGTDHAGIATQSVVEKQLAKLDPPVTRHDLGREKFVERVWEWKEQYGSKIYKQLRRMGSSVDWSRERFTMDPVCARAVTEAFARLNEAGLLYRANRLVNWSSALKSAISDLEVDHVELEGRTLRAVPNHTKHNKYEFGTFTSFAYTVIDDKGGPTGDEVVVATTRLETMLGDPAVAVHPKDPRYAHLHGARLRHPFFPDREVRVIVDDVLVDMDKGTGCVKVTPAHDPNDYDCGTRHGLPFVTIFTLDGAMVEGVDWPAHGATPAHYEAMPDWCAGQMRYDARILVEAKLEEMGLLRGKEDRAMRLAVCSRSGDVIEPLVQPQWFVDCEGMAKRSCDAVRNGDLKIIPKDMERTWFYWLENIRPWCVSRQLWWGHRIPAWFCRLHSDLPKVLDRNADANVDRWIVARNLDEARAKACTKFSCASADSFTLEQDDDVLDTWFSSGLFPFSVFGWPEKTADFEAFYPTTLLETGLDILFFWVARMVMLGLELTDTLPFTSVYLHAMVRDKENRKMSKSLGNVIDPLEITDGCTLKSLVDRLEAGNLKPSEVDKAKQAHRDDFPDGIPRCGADSLRIGLLAYTVQGRDINLDIKRVVGYRAFCNKLWNAVRFMLTNFDDDFKPRPDDVWAELARAVGGGGTATTSNKNNKTKFPLAPRDRFMLSRIAQCSRAMNDHLAAYLFGDAVQDIYGLFINDLCDVYVELVKPVFRDTTEAGGPAREAASYVLWAALDAGFRMLHPFCPFVTEELWQRLPRDAPPDGSIMVAPYPEVAAEGEDNDKSKGLIPAAFIDGNTEAATRLVLACAGAARSLRAAYALANKPADFLFKVKDPTSATQLAAQLDDFNTLAKARTTTAFVDAAKETPGSAAQIVDENVTVLVNLAGLVDVDMELAKLQKQKCQLAPLIDKLQKKIVDPQYVEKAKDAQKDQDSAKLLAYQEKAATIDTNIASWLKMKT